MQGVGRITKCMLMCMHGTYRSYHTIYDYDTPYSLSLVGLLHMPISNICPPSLLVSYKSTIATYVPSLLIPMAI